MPKFDAPVIIVGGGPVGLALALDLGLRRVPSILLERDAGTATVLLAKAGTINERSMEIFRHWGIADKVAQFGFPDDLPRDTIYCTSLNGLLCGSSPLPSTRDRRAPKEGPEMLRRCPQHILDPILAEAAAETGYAEIRYNMRLEALTQDASGVYAAALDTRTGKSETLAGQYLVGADGAGSRVRRSLGIPFEGKDLGTSVSAMLRIPTLDGYHAMPRGERYMFIDETGVWANMTSVDGQELWRFTIIAWGNRDDVPTEEVEKAARRAFGRNDLPFEVVRIMPWRRSQCAAATFNEGRIALVGDSAHTTSPTGGHGLNTGIGDVFGLGWMLQGLVEGWGGDLLLEAHTRERRSVAIRNSASSTQNFGAWVKNDMYENVLDEGEVGEQARKRIGQQLADALYPEWHSLGIGMGYRYENSPIIVGDGTPATPDEVAVYVPTARPGHRAPHAWLEDGRSTLDLFGGGFVLMSLGVEALDPDPLVQAAQHAGLPIKSVHVADRAVAAIYDARLVLIRPDGMVAWRADSAPADPAQLIDTVRGSPVAMKMASRKVAVAVH